METAPMIKRQSYKQKRRKQKQNLLKKRIFFFTFLGLALIGTLSYFFFFSDLFKIQQAPLFTPLQTISKAREIAQKLAETKGKSILFLNESKLTKEILNICPELESVYFKRNFKNRSLAFTYKLKIPAIILCQKENENCCISNSAGALFACAETFSFWNKEGLALLLCPKNEMPPNYLKNIAFLKLFIENNLNLKITFFHCQEESEETIEAITQEEWKIYFNNQEDLTLALTKLKLLLEQEIQKEERAKLEYIDLRFSKAYYK